MILELPPNLEKCFKVSFIKAFEEVVAVVVGKSGFHGTSGTGGLEAGAWQVFQETFFSECG